jgi:hypothetical protein
VAKFSVTLESPLSPEELFDYLADMRNAAKWDPGVADATLEGDAPLGIGSRFLVTLLLGGRPRQVTYELVDYDRPRRVVLSAAQPAFTSTDVVTVAALAGDRSSATYDAHLALHGAFRLGAPLVDALFARIGRRAAAGLRREVGA